MKKLNKVALTVLLIGGLNWGVFGLFGFDIVEMIFGNIPMLARLVYVAVGLSAVYIILESSKKNCVCSDGACCDHECKRTCDAKTCDVKVEVKEEESKTETI